MNRVFLIFIALLMLVGIQASASVYAAPRRVEINAIDSFGSQVRYADTYYVIKDIIDLKGATVNIPKGCTLKIEGGHLKNGKISGSDTYIEAAPYPIFGSTLQFAGTFIASEAYPEWFESTDDAVKIRKSLEYFDNVKLTSKHYLLNSVDVHGYGIVVPEGHMLRGNRRANNIMTDDQVIRMSEGVAYKSVVALQSSTILTDLTIHGKLVDKSSCVSTFEGFNSGITIERVSVSGAYYGFNLQTYLTSLCQCSASYNGVGFYVHGNIQNNSVTVEGTSISLTGCFAVDSKKYGYEIDGITYSTISNCAADGCGAPVSGILNSQTEIGYPYMFSNSKNLTINSCGVEYCMSGIKVQNCKNVIFNSPSLLIDKRKNVKITGNYTLNPIINIRYSAYIVFNYMFVNASGLSRYYTANTPLLLLYGGKSEVPSVVIRNGYNGFKESNIGTEGYMVKSKNLVIQ